MGHGAKACARPVIGCAIASTNLPWIREARCTHTAAQGPTPTARPSPVAACPTRRWAGTNPGPEWSTGVMSPLVTNDGTPLPPLFFFDIHQPRSLSRSSLHEQASSSTVGSTARKNFNVLSHWRAQVLLHEYAEVVSLSYFDPWAVWFLSFEGAKLTH